MLGFFQTCLNSGKKDCIKRSNWDILSYLQNKKADLKKSTVINIYNLFHDKFAIVFSTQYILRLNDDSSFDNTFFVLHLCTQRL